MKQVTAALTIHLVLELDGEGSIEDKLQEISSELDYEVTVDGIDGVHLAETRVEDIEEVSSTDI